MSRLRRYCCILFSFVFLCTSISIGSPQVGKGPPVISLIGLDLTDSSQIGFFFSSHKIDKTYAKEYPLKYFFTTLLVPNDELWVNLSPRLSDMEIVGRGINNTDLGRLLLYYDVKLKENVQRILGLYVDDINAFLMRRDGCGLRFWIEPGVVRMEVDGKKARIKSAPLEVKVEVKGKTGQGLERWLRKKVVPVLRDWVNRGEDYALLRQAFNSMILAQWYKRHTKPGMAFFRYINSRAKGRGIVSDVVWFKSAYLEKYVRMYFGGYSGEGIWSSLVLGGINGQVKRVEEEEGNISEEPDARVFNGDEVARQVEEELNRFANIKKVDEKKVENFVSDFLSVRKKQKKRKVSGNLEEIPLEEGEELVVMNLLVYFDTMKRRIKEFCERLRQGENIKLAFYISDSFLEKCREQQEPPRSLYFALSLYTEMPDRVVLLRKEERGGVKEKWRGDLALVWNSLPTLALIGKNVALIDGGVGKLKKEVGGKTIEGKSPILKSYREVSNAEYVRIYFNEERIEVEHLNFGGEEISEVEEKESKIISTKKGNVRFVGGALDGITSALNGERKEPIYIRVNKDNEGGIRVSLLDVKKKVRSRSDFLALEVAQNGIGPAFLYGENGVAREVFSPINRDKWSMLSILKEAIKKEMQVRYYGEKEEIADEIRIEGVKEVRLRGVSEEDVKKELESIFNNKGEGKRDFYVWICPHEDGYVLRFQPHYPIIYGGEEKDWALLRVDHNTRRIKVVNVGGLDESKVWDVVSRIKKAFMPSTKEEEFGLERIEEGLRYFVGKEFYLEKGMSVVVGKEGEKEEKKQWNIIGGGNGVDLYRQGSEEGRWIGRGGKVFINGKGNFREEFSPDAELIIEVGRDGFVSILGVKEGVNFSLRVEKESDNQQVYVRDIVYKDRYLPSYREFEEKAFTKREFSVMVMDYIDGQMQTRATSEYLVVDWERDIALQSFYEEVVEKVIERLKEKLESEEKDKNIKLEGLNKDLESLSDALIRVDRARVEEIMSKLVCGDIKAEIIRYVYDAIKDTVKYGEQDLKKGTIYFIGDTIDKKRGVCRHTALLTGAVLERLSRAGFLLGRNYLIRIPRHVFNVYVTSAGIPVVLDVAGEDNVSGKSKFIKVTSNTTEKAAYTFSTGSEVNSKDEIQYTEVLRLAGFRIPKPIELNIDNGISTSWLGDLNRNQIGNKMAFVSFSSDLDEKGDESGYILRVRDLSSGKIVQVGAEQVDKDEVRDALMQLKRSNSLLAGLVLKNWDWISQRLQFYVMNDNKGIKFMLKDFFGWGGQGKVIVSSSLLNRLDASTKGLLYLHEILEALVDMGLAGVGIEESKIYVSIGGERREFSVEKDWLEGIFIDKLLPRRGTFTHYLIYELEKSDVKAKSKELTKAIWKEKKERGVKVKDPSRLWGKKRAEFVKNMPEKIKGLLFTMFLSGQWQEGATLDVLKYLYGEGKISVNSDEIGGWEEIGRSVAEKIGSEMGEKTKVQFLKDWSAMRKEDNPTAKVFKRLSLLYSYKVYAVLPRVYEKAVREAVVEFKRLIDFTSREDVKENTKRIEDMINLLSWYSKSQKGRENVVGWKGEDKRGGLVLSLQSLIVM